MNNSFYVRLWIVSLLFVANYTSAHAQWQAMDVVSELDSTQQPSPVIYLTASWCKPCMEKLSTIIDSFGHNPQRPLFVVFDRDGLSTATCMRLATQYDTSYFRSMPAMYSAHNKRSIIEINTASGAFRNLMEDINHTWGTRFGKNDIWIGKALLLRQNKVYATRNDEKMALVKELYQVLAE